VGWAIAIEGRADLGEVLVLLGDQEEAESTADEMRRHGHRVVIQTHPGKRALLPNSPKPNWLHLASSHCGLSGHLA
jgi:hypothetical protein